LSILEPNFLSLNPIGVKISPTIGYKMIKSVYELFQINLRRFSWGLLTRDWDEVRKPNLVIEVGEDGFWPNNTSADVKFLHVKVSNFKRN